MANGSKKQMNEDRTLAELDQRIATAKTRLREKEKLNSMLREAEKSLSEANCKKTQLKTSLSKEESDVAALEGLSLTGMFYSILGSKDERLEKERQQFLAAKLKFDQAVAVAEDIVSEISRIHNKLASVDGAESQYEAVVKEKGEFLTATESEIAGKLLELSERIIDRGSQKKELQEAIQAGESALQAVEQIQRTLASAANWGALDMFGGGILATMAKHSKMDAAKEQARQAQALLLRFQEELADADERLRVSLKIDGFATFADYFFDSTLR